ncbi:MAG: VCBS repeat-containing protein, partial [Chloroflexi bacterium]|nr:VCBS repeat-containing protein [Chloroflexota bacterium]
MATDATISSSVPADFNGDGKPDLVYVNSNTGEMKVVYMDGATQLGQDTLGQLGQDWWLAAVASFDGDGQPDLFLRNYVTGENQVWLMNGINQVDTVVLPPVADTNWVLSAAADFDGDGQTDLVWRNYQTHEVQLWLMNAGSLVNTVALPLAAPDFQLEAASDLNGDGQVDIVWDNPYRAENGVFLMNGTSVATNGDLTKGVDTNWRISGNPYVSPDGHPGLIFRNYLTGHNEVMVFNWSSSDPTRPTVDSARSFDLPAELDTSWLLVDPVGVDPQSMLSAQEVLYLQAEDNALFNGGYNNWDGDASRLRSKDGQPALPGPSFAYPSRAATGAMYQYRKQ